jgi:uncharacterized protein
MNPTSCTAFAGVRLLARGALAEVALAAHAADGPILVFDDATGRVVDLDLSGSAADVAARYAPVAESRGPGRPKLGVVAREVTLLPRQWDWLAAQPGGASAALRRLVDAARKQGEAAERERMARERVYRFLHALGGDFAGFEALSRALFAGDAAGFEAGLAAWPADIAAHARDLAVGAFAAHAEAAKVAS